jgi:DNA-binding transcriptional ArsR family regulator
MSDVFKALADPNRRHLLDMLRIEDGLTLNHLCEQLKMSRQAVSKHLAILESANLINCIQDGRHKHHFLNATPILEIVNRWVNQFSHHQASSLIALKQELENNHEQ